MRKKQKKSKEHKRKISEATSGERNHNFGKHFTAETRRKMSESTSGEKNPNWKGGVKIQNGYRVMRVGVWKYKYEHRLVWEKVNGKIPIGCVIHHINENKLDNRIENLQMLSKSGHIKLHIKLRNDNVSIPNLR